MKKFKSVISLLICLIMTTQMFNVVPMAATNDYENHWAKAQITDLMDRNIVTGYEDGSIKPDNNITRAEFVTLVNKLFKYTEEADTNFPDVKGNAWYAGEFLKAKAAGYLNGDDYGNANPEKDITRAEVCVIAAKVLNLDGVSSTGFTDDGILPQWAKTYIGALAKSNLIKGYPDGSFGASKNITRAEAFVIISNILSQEKPNNDNAVITDNSSNKSENEKSEVTSSDVTENTETTTKKHTGGGGGGGGGGSHSTVTETTTETTTDVDTDGEGLVDSDEAKYGTDINNPDTDGDGFSDFAEVRLMGTDPLVKNEADFDTDGDGLTDNQEVNTYKTDINSKDTDNDSLTDYDEVFVYSTDPNNVDTDGDGLTDSFEVEHKLDPTKESTDGVNKDSEVEIEQSISDDGISFELKSEDNYAKPSLTGKAKGELSDNIFIASSPDTTTAENRAIVGKAVYIDAKDEYVNGLTLSFDLSSYSGDKKGLVIVKLNDEGNFELIDSTVSETAVSCNLTQSGTYCVLNVKEFLDSLDIDLGALGSGSSPSAAYEPYSVNLENNINANTGSNDISTISNTQDCIISGSAVSAKIDEDQLLKLNEYNSSLLESDISGQADIVFVIDSTGSMSGAINNVVTNVVSFATALAENYNVKLNYSLVEFKDIEEDGPDSTQVIKNGYSNWYSNVSDFVKQVEDIYVDGGGDPPESDIDALETARRLDFRKSANKFIILITDVDYKVENNYGITSLEEEIGLLNKDGIITSVVTMPEYREVYAKLYEETGGIFADINDNFSNVLMSLADLIGEHTSGDWVILKHGYRYVKIDSTVEDQDGDGISTTDELGEAQTIDLTDFIKLQLSLSGVPFSEYSGKTSITVYDAKSDPSTTDTDSDGINDMDDTAPWTKGLKDGVLGALKIFSHSEDGPDSSGGFNGHAYVAYTSFVNDSISLYGIYVTSPEECAQHHDTRSDLPSYHNVDVSTNDVVTIGGWAFWLPDQLKGTWINNEKYGSSIPSNQYSLMEYITQSELERIENATNRHSKWTCLYNCSAFATDVWNEALGDNLSAKASALWCSPSGLSYNISKRAGHKVDDQLLAEWP